ncbi:hypothetical protein VNO80_06103 [Phaseolus coccineus]|uniref:PGG domain-containing protein n=1 Tax=Phaseolus coccineus TaxID=3886 RepID=A0AAN9NHG7_PHACN
METFEKYPLELSTARDEEELTALHMLARKPSAVLLQGDKYIGRPGIELLKRIWAEVLKLKMEEIFALITQPSVALFDAIKSENDDEVINTFVELIGILGNVKDPSGRNPLHLLFLHRRYPIFITLVNSRREQLVRAVDNEGNNVLHLAALLPIQFQSFSGLSPYIQMQRELAWFKAERIVPGELRSVRNKKGMRPIDKNNAWFIVFIFTNAVALFTSSASILSFLSNFTSSRFAQSEFVVSLHPSLTFGPVLLIISVAAMVLAFIAASFLIFANTTKWVSYIVAPMGVFALLLFLLFQSKFCDEHFWSRYYRPKLE